MLRLDLGLEGKVKMGCWEAVEGWMTRKELCWCWERGLGLRWLLEGLPLGLCQGWCMGVVQGLKGLSELVLVVVTNCQMERWPKRGLNCCPIETLSQERLCRMSTSCLKQELRYWKLQVMLMMMVQMGYPIAELRGLRTWR